MNIINTYGRAIGTMAGPEMLLLAVLTVGQVNDYAVYEGIVPAHVGRKDAAAWVAQHGAKCSHKRAISYFPDLPADKYRA